MPSKHFDLDTNALLGGDNASDTTIASQKAVKSYTDVAINRLENNINNKADLSTVVTHDNSTAVGGVNTPVYIAADGKATPLSYTIAKAVPSDAEFTDTTYNTFIKSGSSAAMGLVPTPPNTEGTTKFLREDAVWAVPDVGITYTMGTGLSLSGTTINHSNTILADTVGTSTATNGSTIDIPYISYDAQGHIIATGTHIHTVSGFLTEHQDISGKANQTDLDIDSASITAILSRLDVLEDRVANINKTNIEPVSAETSVNLSDTTKDYIIAGTITEASVVNGKSATVKDAEIEQAVLNLSAEDIDIKGVVVDGTYDRNTQGNTMLSIQADGYVTIKDCTITANGYNGLEIGLTAGHAKNILIDNVNFEGTFSNNAINIFSVADDAIITVSNCHFENVSNVIRFSNVTGAKCTLNIINCTCDRWEPTGDYAGPILLQDYTSQTAESVEENNLFALVTINIQNLIKPNGEKAEPVNDISTVCGSGTNQLVYVYANAVGLIAYDEDKYPKLNIV